eukprot:3941811-Rhodomonas_salina.1
METFVETVSGTHSATPLRLLYAVSGTALGEGNVRNVRLLGNKELAPYTDLYDADSDVLPAEIKSFSVPFCAVLAVYCT